MLVGTRLLRGPTFFPWESNYCVDFSFWRFLTKPFQFKMWFICGLCLITEPQDILSWPFTDYSCKYQHWTLLTSHYLWCNLRGEPQGFRQRHNEWNLLFSVPLLTIHNIPSSFFYFFCQLILFMPFYILCHISALTIWITACLSMYASFWIKKK